MRIWMCILLLRFCSHASEVEGEHETSRVVMSALRELAIAHGIVKKRHHDVGIVLRSNLRIMPSGESRRAKKLEVRFGTSESPNDMTIPARNLVDRISMPCGK